MRNGEVQCTSYRVFSVDRLGYESLKPEQETIVREFLGGKNVFAPLPTGYGKSLCNKRQGCLHR